MYRSCHYFGDRVYWVIFRDHWVLFLSLSLSYLFLFFFVNLGNLDTTVIFFYDFVSDSESKCWVLSPSSSNLPGVKMALMLSFNGNDNGLIYVALHVAKPSQFVPLSTLLMMAHLTIILVSGWDWFNRWSPKQCLYQFYKNSAFKNTLAILW